MTEIADFAAVLLLVTGAVGLAVVATTLLGRIPVPAPAIFLLAAALVSDLWPQVYEHVPILTVERIVVVALIVILFNGGMDIGWRRFRFGRPDPVAGCAGNVRDRGPAGRVRALRARPGALSRSWRSARPPGSQAGLILLAGLRLMRHLEDGVQAVAVVVGVVLLGGATASLHGSGFLAVYIAGLLLSDAWARQDGAQHVVPEALSAVAEPLLFATLGAAFAPLVGLDHIGYGIFLMVVTVFVVRPLVASACLIGSDLPAPDRALVSWGGLKGAVPLLLAGYPALEHFDEAGTVAAIVLVATAASLLVQGGTLPLVADRAVKRRSAEPELGAHP